MIVSYNWLQEYFKDPLPQPKELASILNTRAFEIEGVEEVGDDHTIDVDVLPNRSADCFCHYGIAKEIAVHTGLAIEQVYHDAPEADFETTSTISIEDPRCYRFVMAEVQNPVVGPSPDALRKKLETLGQQSINTIVDITNIVMLEIGQPMHAFDKELVVGGNLIVRATKEGEQITTLDNQEVTFKEGDLTVADAEKPLSIAPIKGGKLAGVTEETQIILLESASWNRTFARKITRRTGISTESGKRFEHGVSPELARKGMIRAVELIKQYASDEHTKISGLVDVYPRPPKHPYYVGTSVADLNKRLGLDLSTSDIEDIFDRLQFSYKKINVKERFIETLQEAVGKPYVYGASVLHDAPDAFDCSSLVAYAASRSGYSAPRISVDQYVWTDEISENDLEPGDLIFSNQHSVDTKKQEKFKDRPEIQAMIAPERTTAQQFMPGTKIEKPIDHVGIYMGDGNVIHCTSADDKGVVMELLATSEQFADIVSYRRMIPKGEERYVVSVPDERVDIRISEDLSEEVGRVYGYEKLPEPAITGNEREPEINKIVAYNTAIRKALVEAGFSEIMTSSFRTKGELKVLKSFADDRKYLRDDLRQGMETALDLNVYNADLLGLEQVKVFEIGKKFTSEGETLVLCLGVKNNKIKKPKPVETLQQALEIIEKVVGQKVAVSVEDAETIVEINLDVLYDGANIPESYADFDSIEDVKYVIPSAYPFVLRDISVWVPGSTDQDGVVRQIILDTAGDLLIREKLVDVFEKDGRTSYSFRLVFQSYEKTLTDVEVNAVMDTITNAMHARDGWEVR